MGLFDKKYCDVCGEKIGLLGNRKLEDGNLCKDCAAKLSPWFSGRRHSALADIKEQLAQREANKAEASAFRMTRKLGKASPALFLDEGQGKFAVCSESELKNGNPDILKLSDVVSCTTETRENRSERKYKDKDGKLVSYVPPQFDYSYEYFCTILVNHPYIDEIRFRLNDFNVKPTTGLLSNGLKTMDEYRDLCREIEAVMSARNSMTANAPAEIPEVSAFENFDSYLLSTRKVLFPAGPAGKEFYVDGCISYATLRERAASASEAGNLIEAVVEEELRAMEAEGLSAEAVEKNPAILSPRAEERLKTLLSKGVLTHGVVISMMPASVMEDPQRGPQVKKALDDMMTMSRANAHVSFLRAREEGTLGGSNSQSMPAAAADGPWECPACGAKNENGKFCAYCGSPRK